MAGFVLANDVVKSVRRRRNPQQLIEAIERAADHLNLSTAQAAPPCPGTPATVPATTILMVTPRLPRAPAQARRRA